MVKLVEEKPISGRIDLRFEGFVSKCPFMTDMDRTDLDLSYEPGRSFDGSPVKIDAKKLEADLASFEAKAMQAPEVPIEVIPIQVLKYCVEQCVNQSAGRYASPEEFEINSISVSATPTKGKDWGMKVNLKFSRQVLPVFTPRTEL